MAAETEAATALLEAFALYADPTSDRPPKLATVDGSYTSGLPRVRFDGETVTSGKGYAWLGPYVPRPNDRVALLPVGTSYLILGPVRTALGGDFRISGTASGLVMQSPNGTYWRLRISNAGGLVSEQVT